MKCRPGALDLATGAWRPAPPKSLTGLLLLEVLRSLIKLPQSNITYYYCVFVLFNIIYIYGPLTKKNPTLPGRFQDNIRGQLMAA